MTRWSYFGRRLLLAVPILVFGMTMTFVIIRLGPLDPVAAILGTQSGQRAYDEVARELGMNKPLWEQYFAFMWDLITFNLGKSWVVNRNTQTIELIGIYAPRTIWLGFWSVLIAVFVGIPLGFYAGLHPNTFPDYFASFGGIVWRAMPNFWLAVMLVAILSQSAALFFGFDWQSFLVETNVIGPPDLNFWEVTDTTVFGIPTGLTVYWGTIGAATKKILPAAVVLGSASMGNEMRIARTAVLETINSNYVETARAKGLYQRTIIWKHIFRNALIPLVPIITNEAYLLIGGSVVVEIIFGVNGLGFLFYQAVINADLPLAGSLMFIFILIVVSMNILQDFLYTVIDPRVGFER